MWACRSPRATAVLLNILILEGKQHVKQMTLGRSHSLGGCSISNGRNIGEARRIFRCIFTSAISGERCISTEDCKSEYAPQGCGEFSPAVGGCCCPLTSYKDAGVARLSLIAASSHLSHEPMLHCHNLLVLLRVPL